jgi:hypothetical protein
MISPGRTTRIAGQRVRNMTVQVRDPVCGEVRGTGVLVSPSGMVVTCAHVVRDCGIDPRQVDGRLVVQIPATPEHREEERDARIHWFPGDFDDDLVLLQLGGGPVPPERVGTCGPADNSDDHPFRSYGFRRRDEYLGLHAKGSIEGHVPSPRHLFIEPVQLESKDLDSGMSGAAVFDVERNLVIGFVFQVWEPGESAKDSGLAFAVDAAVLMQSPVAELLVPTLLEPGAMTGPEVDQSIQPTDLTLTAPQSQVWMMDTAPESLGVFVGRHEELAAIERVWQEGSIRVLGLSGINGQGKTSLVRTWLDGKRDDSAGRRPQNVFWWTFDPDANEIDDFLAAIIKHISAGAINPDILPLGTAKANLAAALLEEAPEHIIVMDGLDRMQVPSGDLRGSFTSQALRDFLGYMTAGRSRSLCIVTAPHECRDLEHLVTFEGLPMERLSHSEGLHLLTANGVEGTDSDLNAIVEDWEGHPLALTAVATYIRQRFSGIARRIEDIPGGDSDLPLISRLTTIGVVLERQRSPLEQVAITILALVRLPLPLPDLARLVGRIEPRFAGAATQAELATLAASEVIRATQQGDLLLHPVLRNLYRLRLRKETAQRSGIHRMLAEYYYDNALKDSLS